MGGVCLSKVACTHDLKDSIPFSKQKLCPFISSSYLFHKYIHHSSHRSLDGVLFFSRFSDPGPQSERERVRMRCEHSPSKPFSLSLFVVKEWRAALSSSTEQKRTDSKKKESYMNREKHAMAQQRAQRAKEKRGHRVWSGTWHRDPWRKTKRRKKRGCGGYEITVHPSTGHPRHFILTTGDFQGAEQVCLCLSNWRIEQALNGLDNSQTKQGLDPWFRHWSVYHILVVLNFLYRWSQPPCQLVYSFLSRRQCPWLLFLFQSQCHLSSGIPVCAATVIDSTVFIQLLVEWRFYPRNNACLISHARHANLPTRKLFFLK